MVTYFSTLVASLVGVASPTNNTIHLPTQTSQPTTAVVPFSAAPAQGPATYAEFTRTTDTIRILGDTLLAGGPFTYEFRIWLTAPAIGYVIGEQQISVEDKCLELGENQYRFSVAYDNPLGYNAGSSPEIVLGRWMHIAYVADTTSRIIYVDGQPAAVLSRGQSYADGTDSNMAIGMFQKGKGYLVSPQLPSFIGKLDWVRISKTPRYSGAFTPPVESSLIADPQTVLLLKFNEPTGTTTLIDESPNQFVCEVGVPVNPGLTATSPMMGRVECTGSFVSVSPEAVALLPGSSVAFQATAATGVTAYQWLKDGVPLSDDDRISGSATATLTITGITNADQGLYACRIENACGIATSSPTPLSCKPIILQSAPAATPQKRTLALTLGVPANAPYTYAWRRNGVPIANLAGVYSGAFTNTLRILSPDFIRGGTFDCVLTDVCGQTISASTRVCLADFNLDTNVDDADFVSFVRDYDTLLCADPTMSPGCFADFNNDTVVDDADFLFFTAAYDELLCP